MQKPRSRAWVVFWSVFGACALFWGFLAFGLWVSWPKVGTEAPGFYELVALCSGILSCSLIPCFMLVMIFFASAFWDRGSNRYIWFAAAFGYLVAAILGTVITRVIARHQDVLTYTLQLRPGMVVQEVQASFPRSMHWQVDVVDEPNYNPSMNRRFSTNPVTTKLMFKNPQLDSRITTVYADSADEIVGVSFSASAGPRLQDDDLRFPEEILLEVDCD